MTSSGQKRRRWSGAIPVFAALAGMAMACHAKGRAPRFETVPVSRGLLQQHVTASGTVNALVSVDVGSQVSGKIVALRADFNEPVKKGQLLAEIDASLYLAALRQAEGDLGNAKATTVLKHQNLVRKQALVPLRAASQADLDQAQAEVAQAEATMVIKRASLQSARANLGYCKIVSPIDGVVISRKVDVGQTLAAAMTTPVLFTIAQDLTKISISAAVSEADIGQVQPGQPSEFTVDAFPDQVFRGRVAQVRRAPTTTSNVVTYETVIDADNPNQRLFPGMTAEVSILVAERADVLRISNAALRFTPPDGTAFEEAPPRKLEQAQRLAYVVGSDGTKLRPLVVKVGFTDGVESELVEGASQGVRVVTGASAMARSSTGSQAGRPPEPPTL